MTAAATTGVTMDAMIHALAALQGPLLEGIVKISVVLLLALGSVALLRRQSAATRHWLLAAAIACALAMPLLTLVVPSWHLAAAGISSAPALTDALARQLTLSSHAGVPTGTDARTATLDSRGSLSPIAARLTDASGARSGRALPPVTRRIAVIAALVALWLAGAALNLAVLAAGLGRLAWLAARATRGPRPDDAWQALARDMAREYGVRRRVRLLHSGHPTLLVTWGSFRPTILLPAAARDWPQARMRVVLAHELAHIARGDWATQMTAELLRALAWCTPFAWVAARRLRAESEQASDDAVLQRGIDAPEYASHLVALARAFTQRRDTWSPALGMVRQSAFERRIRAMLNVRLNRAPLTLAARLAITLAFTAVTLPIAGLAASAQPAPASLAAIVRNPRGTPLADVQVSLTQATTQKVHQAKSDNGGRVAFSDLPAGDYTIAIEQMGFRPLKESLALAEGKRLERDIKLTLGTVQETISVKGASEGPPKTNPPGDVAKYMPSAAGAGDAKPLDPPMKTRHANPVYPAALRDAGIKGTVGLQATIAKDGTVAALKVVKSVQPDLDKAAMDAVRLWRYVPTRLDGVAVETDMTITITFAP